MRDEFSVQMCVCGHTDGRGKHAGRGPCGAYKCSCTEFRRVGRGVPAELGAVYPTFKGEQTHTARMAK